MCLLLQKGEPVPSLEESTNPCNQFGFREGLGEQVSRSHVKGSNPLGRRGEFTVEHDRNGMRRSIFLHAVDELQATCPRQRNCASMSSAAARRHLYGGG